MVSPTHTLPLDLLASLALGAASLLSVQPVPPAPAQSFEQIVWQQLGVAAVVVIGAYVMLRYFMAALDRKDAVLQQQHQALVEVVERGHAVQIEAANRHLEAARNTADALNRITLAIEADRRGDR